MTLMARLQNLTLAKMELDDAVELNTDAFNLRAGYQRHQLPTPAWLDDGIRTLDRFILDQSRDAAEMRLRELAAEDATDRSMPERRAARKAEREALEAKLGRVTTTV